MGATASSSLSSELSIKQRPGKAAKIGWKTSQRWSTVEETVWGSLEEDIMVEFRTV